jgi:hypothetical protein
MARFARPQFSLATLLIAMAWSAVVVWLGIEPRFVGFSHVNFGDNGLPPESWRIPGAAAYGLPWTYGLCYGFFDSPLDLPRLQAEMICDYRALTGDITVGVLLIAVLTWGSSHLLRRVGARLRRRSASKLGEQPTLRSRGK